MEDINGFVEYQGQYRRSLGIQNQNVSVVLESLIKASEADGKLELQMTVRYAHDKKEELKLPPLSITKYAGETSGKILGSHARFVEAWIAVYCEMNSFAGIDNIAANIMRMNDRCRNMIRVIMSGPVEFGLTKGYVYCCKTN